MQTLVVYKKNNSIHDFVLIKNYSILDRTNYIIKNIMFLTILYQKIKFAKTFIFYNKKYIVK